jgi:hypothetical protein
MTMVEPDIKWGARSKKRSGEAAVENFCTLYVLNSIDRTLGGTGHQQKNALSLPKTLR